MAPALIGKSTELRPAGTVIDAGTVSTVGTLVDNETGVPPAGAALLSWTVQRALVFGVSVVAEHVSEEGPGALPTIEIITVRLVPPRETVTEVTWFDVMVPAVNWKPAVVAPAATVDELGKVNIPAGLADIVRRMPPAGAGFEMVAVQFVELEDIKVVLAQTTDDKIIGAVIVKAMALLEPLSEAVMVGVWTKVTVAAVAVKVAVVAAAATVTDAGTVNAEVALLERVTAEPPAGATLESVTVQGVVEDAARVVLVHCREVKVIGGAVIVRLAVLLEPLRVAVMVGVWSEVTAAAVAVKVAVVTADATVTDVGTVTADVALLDRATVEPPVGAALESVTVQVVVDDAARVVLVHCSEVRVIGGAVMVRLTVLLEPLRVAVMVGVWSDVTAAAVAVKVAVVAAGATVTEAGTVNAEVALLESVTVEPPVGAALESVTVQVVVDDAASVVLVHCGEVRVLGCAVLVRLTVLLEPLRVAVMVGVWSDVTAAAVAVKVAVVAAAATVTEAGTVNAEVALLESVTVEPLVGAALESVTVQVVVEDAARVVLVHCREVSVIGATSDRLAVELTPFRVALMVAA
ncbi:MAG: hypothetical protein JWO19_2353 [Bryobacterales bacterium]|nr:hypothetical protein [Bryobacterales bacterium]